MLQALVFDFDGVIVDTEPLHYRAFLRVFEPLGIEFDYDQYLDRYIGFDDRDAIAAIASDHDRPIADIDVPAMLRAKSQAFDAIVAEGVTPFPGAVELIESAAAAMPIALCSGALRSDIDAVFPTIGSGDLLSRFDAIVTADDVVRSKPDPQSYRLAAERLSLPPRCCLAIEDTPAGLASARGAGLHTLAVAHSYGADQLADADRVAASLAEVTLDHIRQWFGGSTIST